MTRKVPKTPPEQFPQIFAESLVHVFQQRELTDGLARWAQSDPGAFYSLLAKLMPSELHLTSEVAGEPGDLRETAMRVAFMLAKAAHETQLIEADPIRPAVFDSTPLPQETPLLEPKPPQNGPESGDFAQNQPESSPWPPPQTALDLHCARRPENLHRGPDQRPTVTYRRPEALRKPPRY